MNAFSAQRSSGFFPGLLKAVFIILLVLSFAACGNVRQLDDPQVPSFTVGGNVQNLTGSGLVLQNCGTDDLAIAADGAFTFPATLITGHTYCVEVLTQPSSPSQACAVLNAGGTIANADVTDVIVDCDGHTVGGTVSGMTGSGLILAINGGYYLDIAADGAFTFTHVLLNGDAYNVTILNNPTSPSQTCSVTNGTGTISGANVTNVLVNCP